MVKELPKDIILFSTADWDNLFWTNKQHVAAMLGEKGFRVLYVESAGLRRPVATSKDFSRILRRLKKSFGGIRQVRLGYGPENDNGSLISQNGKAITK